MNLFFQWILAGAAYLALGVLIVAALLIPVLGRLSRVLELRERERKRWARERAIRAEQARRAAEVAPVRVTSSGTTSRWALSRKAWR